MENKEQQLPVDQNENSDIDRTRELFEYEMTQVLLGFRREAVRFRRKDVSQYLDMELPPAGVDFVSSETEPGSVDYTEAEPIEPIDFSMTAPEVTKADMPDIPESRGAFTALKAGSVSVPAEFPDVSGRLAAISAAAAFTDIPDTAGNLPQSNTILPHDFTDRAVIEKTVVIPHIGEVQTEAPGVSVPDIGMHSVGADIASVDMDNIGFKAEIPSTQMDSGKFAAGSVNVSEAPVSFPFPGTQKLRTGFDSVFFGAEPAQTDFPFEPVQEFSLSCKIIPCAEIPADMDIPFSELYRVDYDTGSVVVDKVQPSADINVIAVKKDLFSVAEVSLSGVRISVTEAAPVAFPSFSDVSLALPDHPEIPPKPDFSGYCSDILESVRNDR